MLCGTLRFRGTLSGKHCPKGMVDSRFIPGAHIINEKKHDDDGDGGGDDDDDDRHTIWIQLFLSSS